MHGCLDSTRTAWLGSFCALLTLSKQAVTAESLRTACCVQELPAFAADQLLVILDFCEEQEAAFSGLVRPEVWQAAHLKVRVRACIAQQNIFMVLQT